MFSWFKRSKAEEPINHSNGIAIDHFKTEIDWDWINGEGYHLKLKHGNVFKVDTDGHCVISEFVAGQPTDTIYLGQLKRLDILYRLIKNLQEME